MPLTNYSTLDELIGIYAERANRESVNRDRIKQFYNNDVSFTSLMNRIIQKDTKRFTKLIEGETNLPNPWRVLYVVMDIVQHDGEEVPPFDTLTRMLPSRSIIYHGWTFSWVHGEGTLISIYNNHDELVYRF